MPIKVVVIEDSPVTRAMLGEMFSASPAMELVGSAASLLRAADLIRESKPDVLLLDAEMPHMESLDFLARLMRLRPMPVVMLSSLSPAGFEATMGAMELGAVDFVVRRGGDVGGSVFDVATEIADKVRAAYGARVRITQALPSLPGEMQRTHAADTVISSARDSRLVVAGSSSAGTESLKYFLMSMPSNAPAILVAHHMPEGFTASFARRLDTICAVRVKEAEHGEPVVAGHAYLAPGDANLMVRRVDNTHVIHLTRDPSGAVAAPSVDVLFRSAARNAAGPTAGVLLCGIGSDGARGMVELKQAGAYTVAQDHASSIVYGMPREAVALGAVSETSPLRDMATRVINNLAIARQRPRKVA